MTPLLLFLLLSAAIYLGTVTAAFSALMRLSLRIMAERSERGERGDALGPYLDDPRRLFVPARLLLSASRMVRWMDAFWRVVWGEIYVTMSRSPCIFRIFSPNLAELQDLMPRIPHST